MKLCTFIGLGQVKDEERIKREVEQQLIKLLNEGVTTFLFGGGEFNDLCYNVVTDLKETYTYIQRIYYPCGDENCFTNVEDEKNKCYKQKEYEKTEHINFGSLNPVMLRNKRLIDECDVCLMYAIGSYARKQDDEFKYQPSYKINPEFNITPTKRAIIIKA